MKNYSLTAGKVGWRYLTNRYSMIHHPEICRIISVEQNEEWLLVYGYIDAVRGLLFAVLGTGNVGPFRLGQIGTGYRVTIRMETAAGCKVLTNAGRYMNRRETEEAEKQIRHLVKEERDNAAQESVRGLSLLDPLRSSWHPDRILVHSMNECGEITIIRLTHMDGTMIFGIAEENSVFCKGRIVRIHIFRKEDKTFDAYAVPK